jgi:protein-S-isoprenylcysteine O-methyltransferase Ste14
MCQLIVFIVASAFLAYVARASLAQVEETENLRFFGPAHQAYMQQTRRFIPFLF